MKLGYTVDRRAQVELKSERVQAPASESTFSCVFALTFTTDSLHPSILDRLDAGQGPPISTPQRCRYVTETAEVSPLDTSTKMLTCQPG